VRVKALADTSDLRDRMKMWSDLVGKEVGEGLRQHARVACVELANVTQPYGRDKSSGLPGKRAVDVDISKVFYEARPDGGFVKGLTEMVKKSYQRRAQKVKGFNAEAATEKFKNRVNQYAAANNVKALRELAERFKWQGVVDTIDPALHERARTARRRKVPKKRGNMYLYLGPRGALRKYKDKQKEKVGLTKAGWAVCAERIPLQRASSATRGIPQWVTRNKKRAQDSYINDQSNDARNPKVTMTNAAPWASENISPAEATKALDIARNKFVKYMNTQIKYELKRRAGLK
jgi:hypothetical protein